MSSEVAQQIREAILDGSIQAGDRLPAERELAQRFGVNRSTVREALRLLEEEGLVATRQGAGTRARNVLEAAGLRLLPHLLVPGGVLDAGLLRDLFELRCELNAWSARVAARRRDDAATDALRPCLADCEEAGNDPERCQVADYELFYAVARASGNRVLILIMNTTRSVYLAHRTLFTPLFQDFDLGARRRLVEAVAAGDEAAAEEAARSAMAFEWPG